MSTRFNGYPENLQHPENRIKQTNKIEKKIKLPGIDDSGIAYFMFVHIRARVIRVLLT